MLDTKSQSAVFAFMLFDLDGDGFGQLRDDAAFVQVAGQVIGPKRSEDIGCALLGFIQCNVGFDIDHFSSSRNDFVEQVLMF